MELRTQRLVLRPFQTGDVVDSLAYRNDAEFVRFLPHIPFPFTMQDAERFVSLNMSEPWDTSPTFAVILDGKLTGTVNLEIDPATRSAMLGYAIGRTWWGLGIATEAATATMLWGIKASGLTRVWASTDTRHIKSQRVMEKLGMKRESVQVEHHRGRNGELIDEVVYGLDISRQT